MKVQKRGTAFRGELEGVRGIALVIILFSHLTGWPTGGFVALDAFFVLSGFLITGLLLREYDASGTISFAKFYRRRVRRLMPSALLVLVLTVVGAVVIFRGTRVLSTIWDAIWSLLLVSNWNFAINGTDYFATTLPQSPLLHFWSLSVEEQFYLVWPALVLLLLLLGAPRGRGRRRRGGTPRRGALIIGLVVITALSLAWSVYSSDVNPQVAYLSTLTRVWELGLGALLCFGVAMFAKIPAVLRPILGYVGLVVLVVPAFLFTPSIHYPGAWALIPVLGTALIVIAGTGGNSYLWPASNPVARYLGKISYTSYLWHWPVFILTAAITLRESPVYLYATIPFSLLMAALTTRFVEDPIRLSQWLEPRGHHPRPGEAARRERRSRLAGPLAISGAALAVIIVVIVVAVPRTGSGEPVLAAAAASTPTAGANAVDTELARLNTGVLAGLDATSWPSDLTPSLDDLGEKAYAPQWITDNCLETSSSNASSCVYGDASLPKTAVLLGDSTAISYMPGLQPALNSLGYRVHVLTHAECPAAKVQVLGANTDGQATPGFPGVCDDARAWSVEQAISLKPDLVVVTDGEVELDALAAKGTAEQQIETYGTGMADTLGALAPAASRIVVLSSNPGASNLNACATKFNGPKDCTTRISQNWFDLLAKDKSVAGGVMTASGRPVDVVDTSEWYCSAQSDCPPFAGSTIIRADAIHLTSAYAAQLQNILALTFSALLAPV